ncbi:hypothetical protein PYCC9005_001151 [Savitreella phatthalungensis]
MDSIRETLSKAAADVQKTVQPYVDQAAAATKPYVDQAAAATKPYVDQATAATKPYLEQAHQATKPYLDSASAAVKDAGQKINTAITGEPAAVDADGKAYKPIGPLSPKEEKKLDDALAHRPSPEELQQKNILKQAGNNVAPALQAKQDQLKKSQLEDTLDAKIAGRPDQKELEGKGILKPQ